MTRMELSAVYVIGHRNPDVDSICSALGYAEFLRRTRLPEAEAACCGEIDSRTQFVLQRAGLPPPKLMMDVRLTAGQLCQRQVVTAGLNEGLLSVYRRMQEHQFRALPVVGGDGRLCGMLSLHTMLELMVPDAEHVTHERGLLQTSLECIREAVGGEFEHVVDARREEKLAVMVGAMSSAGFTQRLHQCDPARTIIVCGDRPSVQRLALEYRVRCLVITGGYRLSAELGELAARSHVSVLVSPADTATTSMMIRAARIITPAVESTFLKYSEHALVSQIRKDVHHSAQGLFPVIDEDGLMSGVFSKSDLVEPPPVRLILVDHNEFTQAVTGVDEAEILEVVDHHRLGGNLHSRHPIRFINEPFGSTSTIITSFYHQRHFSPPEGIGCCLAAGIIADTLNLTSPTTTDTDRMMLRWISEACHIDVGRYAADFFSAGSSLSLYSPEQAVRLDCKEYAEGAWKFAVAQIEENGLDLFWARKESLEQALFALVADRSLDFACVMVTDITSHVSMLLCAGDAGILGAIDYPRKESHLFEMEGVVSRKKQLLPHLSLLLSRMDKGVSARPG